MTRQRLHTLIRGVTFLVHLLPFFSQGQVNLVRNWSFEQHTNCSGFGICSSTGVDFWYEPTASSSDWFNNCNSSFFWVPQNDIGYQWPRSGQSYAGIDYINHTSPAYAEYIEGQFLQGLIAGRRYCVTFYVSLADSAWYGISALGAYLSNSEVCMGTYYDTLPYRPQIVNPPSNPITDKINWVPISGEFAASGGEQWITIGCFDSSAFYTFVGGGCYGCNVYGETYYYVDDVYVREIISAHAGSGKDTLICLGNKIQIGQDSPTPGIHYQWLPTIGLANPNSAQTFASPTITTTYTLTVINDSMKGCNCPDSVSKDSITIKVDDFIGSACCNSTITNGQPVILNSTPAYKHIWTPSTGLNCDTCQSVSANPSVTTTYYVTVYDSMRCKVTDTLTVTVEQPCGQLFIPNAFSPNGDGQNDVFLIKDNCLSSFHIEVFDRWGEKVFVSENINDGWDGTYKGKPMNAGTYMYDMQVINADGTTFNKKGSLVLVR